MKSLSFAFAVCSLVSLAWATTVARERYSGGAADAVSIAPPAQQNDQTASLPCKEVVVETDEGYGVSSHETRYECAPRN